MKNSKRPVYLGNYQAHRKGGGSRKVVVLLSSIIGAGLLIGFSANMIISSEVNVRKSLSDESSVLAALEQRHQPALIDYEDEQGFTEEPDYVEIERGQIPEEIIVHEGTVKRGDSLYAILASNGLSPLEIHHITQQLKDTFSVNSFRVGQKYEIHLDPDENFRRFIYHQNRVIALHIEQDMDSGEFHTWKDVREFDKRVNTIVGTINNSLSQELQRHNRYALISQLENVFSWQVNFNRDIQPGTRYKVIFEENWLNDQFMGTGRILAAEINIRNREYRAYYYVDADSNTGYYNDQGDSVQRFFLSKPVDYSRISSDYGYRIHPVYGTRHFHGGVDLVAPTGTPVRAVADGKVVFRGRKGPAGNLVTIAHANGYHSQYLHLSRYAANVRYGSRVEQGDVIGYVGMTGVATGPHLDFRVIRNGKLQNPMQTLAASSSASSVASKHKNDFLAKRGMLRAQLDELDIQLARLGE